VPKGLVLEEEVLEDEQVEPQAFQVQEEVAEEVLEEEAKEEHVDPHLGRQLECVQADWDTRGVKKNIKNCKKHPSVLCPHTTLGWG